MGPLLTTDESGMPTVEYSTIDVYTVRLRSSSATRSGRLQLGQCPVGTTTAITTITRQAVRNTLDSSRLKPLRAFSACRRSDLRVAVG
jgi:hypothetical protein